MRDALLPIYVAVSVCALNAAKAQSSDPEIKLKIQAIESNIAPAALIKGWDAPHVSLVTRMAALVVPGRSCV
jgi:hypothetical protein